MMTQHHLVCILPDSQSVFTQEPFLTAAKGQFIADMGLAGFAMWEAGGDSGDILLDAISGAMGIDASQCH